MSVIITEFTWNKSLIGNCKKQQYNKYINSISEIRLNVIFYWIFNCKITDIELKQL